MTGRRIAEIRAIPDDAQRAKAAGDYASLHSLAYEEAIQVRDEAILKLAAEHGVTKASRLAGVSVSRVKQIRLRSVAA